MISKGWLTYIGLFLNWEKNSNQLAGPLRFEIPLESHPMALRPRKRP